jgi:hypothetical protein
MSKKITVSTELRYVDIDVEISLGDINTDDLIEELKSRGGGFNGDTTLDEIAKQIAFGNNDRAIDLTKNYIYQNTGRIVS